MAFTPIVCSLADLVGRDYIEAVCSARAALSGADAAAMLRSACEPLEFWPESLQRRLHELLPSAGKAIAPAWTAGATGAGTQAFDHAAKIGSAPLSGLGYFRVGQDGRLYVISKSEHYHASLGHAFPGFALLERARALGIPNATHNNTRGPITRRLEMELVRAAAGLSPSDNLDGLLHSQDAEVLNRVLNLETGSLAAEAALKLALCRFYHHEPGGPEPRYANRTPVVLVLGDDDGGVTGNYHGTTVLTQVLRGLWPELRGRFAEDRTLEVAAVRPNSLADLDAAFRKFETPPYKIAAFFHEIVMMNYGARRLTEEFLHHAYRLARQHDVPTVADEIQSCTWYEGLFLFRQYGLKPSMVAIGKGFSGGEYPASRLLFSAPLDVMPQFGALVTNGQEELASLAYLITMKWVEANGPAIAAIGRRLEKAFQRLGAEFPSRIAGVEGRGHLLGLRFHDLAGGRAFVEAMNRMGFDISVQTYKTDCPPVALTKLPTIADDGLVDFTVERMREALRHR
jgi:acetylornithine/succinyldiaminopimelate/putrescine aminotransferase